MIKILNNWLCIAQIKPRLNYHTQLKYTHIHDPIPPHSNSIDIKNKTSRKINAKRLSLWYPHWLSLNLPYIILSFIVWFFFVYIVTAGTRIHSLEHEKETIKRSKSSRKVTNAFTHTHTYSQLQADKQTLTYWRRRIYIAWGINEGFESWK